MFCALVSMIALLLLMICGVTVSAVDIEDYNFGLYYALLAIVGMMVACAICVLKPPNCKNPKWYDDCCITLEIYVSPNAPSQPGATSTCGGPDHENQRSRSDLPAMNRRTLVMLGPAVQLMQTVMRGLASETDMSLDEDDMTLSKIFEDSDSVSSHRFSNNIDKRLHPFSAAMTSSINHGKNHKLLTPPVISTVPETILEEPTIIASSCSKNSMTVSQLEQMIDSIKQNP